MLTGGRVSHQRGAQGVLMLMDVNNCYHCRLYISVSPTAHITHILYEEGREGGIWSVMHLFERGVAFTLGVWGQGHFLLTLLLLCFWCFLFPLVVVSRVLEEELPPPVCWPGPARFPSSQSSLARRVASAGGNPNPYVLAFICSRSCSTSERRKWLDHVPRTTCWRTRKSRPRR